MSVSLGKDNEVHVTYEDQQKINQFARTNARLQDFKEELEQKKKDVQNIEDAEADLMLIEDDDALIPNLIGEVFVNCTSAVTLARLEKAKIDLKSEMASLERSCNDHKAILSNLKVQLYAKFGNNINLENEDD